MKVRLPTAQEDSGYHSISAAIGRCITCWARIEDETANLFTHTTRASEELADHIASRHIFYAVESFRAKLSLVDAAITNCAPVSDEFKAEWAKLMNKLSKKSIKRNQIAHCASIKREDGIFYADPYCAFTSKLSGSDKTLLKEAELMDRATSFINLAIQVANFQERLATHLQGRSTSALLLTHPKLRSDNQTTPTLEEPSKPLES